MQSDEGETVLANLAQWVYLGRKREPRREQFLAGSLGGNPEDLVWNSGQPLDVSS